MATPLTVRIKSVAVITKCITATLCSTTHNFVMAASLTRLGIYIMAVTAALGVLVIDYIGTLARTTTAMGLEVIDFMSRISATAATMGITQVGFAIRIVLPTAAVVILRPVVHLAAAAQLCCWVVT